MLTLTVLTGMLPLTACSDGAGAALRYDISTVITSLDPQYANTEDAKIVVRNAFEGLYGMDKEGDIVRASAQSEIVSGDGLTVTITLREGLLWSDEEPLTADDFEFALKRLFNPDFPSPFSGDFLCIKNAGAILRGEMDASRLGVRAKDGRTLIISLEYPVDYLPQLLSSTAAMPCRESFFTETRGRYGLDESMLVFNGPFYVKYWEAEKYVQLRRNAFYHDEASVAPDRLTFDVADPAQRFARLTSGKTDAAMLTYDEWTRIADKGYTYEKFEDTVWTLLFNQKVPFLESAAARRALMQAIDPLSYAPNLGNDLNDTRAFLPPSLRLQGKGYRQLAGFNRPETFDPQAALSSLRIAVSEKGSAPDLTILSVDNGSHPVSVGMLQKNWREHLSVTVNARFIPQADLEKAVRAGDFDLAVVPLRPDSQRPGEMLGQFRSDSARNVVSYHSQAFDALMDREAAAGSPQEQLDILMQAEDLLIQDAVVVPLYFQTHYYAVGKGVSGIHFSPFAGEISFKEAVKR